ncbi:MAG: hypothetical protein ACLVFS_04265 [Butyricicoccus sp.]
MKKLTAMLLALTLCFGLAACGGITAQDDTNDERQTVQTGKTEDKGRRRPRRNPRDQDRGAKTETKTDDRLTDAKPRINDRNQAGDEQHEHHDRKAVASGTSKPFARRANRRHPLRKASRYRAPAASAPAETKPAEPAKPTASQASGYVGSSASALESALGAPTSKSYSPSCMGEGEDGIWTYDGFTVYTYKEGGSETVEAVQ